MDPAPQSVNVRRTREDYFAFNREVTKGLRNISIYYYVSLVVIVLLLMGVTDILFERGWFPLFLLKNLYLYYALMLLVMLCVLLLLRRYFTPGILREYVNENQAFLREKQVSIDVNGIRELSDVSDTFVKWQGVDRIEKTGKLLLVFVDRLSAFCIPTRNFSTPQEAEQFYESMLAYWRKANQKA